MGTVREVVAKRNELLMQMAFSLDVVEVRELMKQVKTLENDIKCMTLN